MTTPLRTSLKRGLIVGGREYVVTLTPTNLKLTLKGRRNGFELPWAEIVNGGAALAVALQASVGAFTAKPSRPKDEPKPRSHRMQARRKRA